jgi:hypothetical protein
MPLCSPATPSLVETDNDKHCSESAIQVCTIDNASLPITDRLEIMGEACLGSSHRVGLMSSTDRTIFNFAEFGESFDYVAICLNLIAIVQTLCSLDVPSTVIDPFDVLLSAKSILLRQPSVVISSVNSHLRHHNSMLLSRWV